MARGSQVVTG
ncbi:hypothetical protein E2C01_076767 [Portunus trituberculatus]|uniref:Uncharacterized protein n=1 Tax=Portunus trituberculatus TaxID=210409 RepID=A0A5B7IE19_PORTR|nr:hypothetical protein [Portunus trituberculatus]